MGEGTEEVKYATVDEVRKVAECLVGLTKLYDSLQRQIDILAGRTFPALTTPEQQFFAGSGIGAVGSQQIIDKTDEYDKQKDIEAEGQRAANYYNKKEKGEY